MSTPRNYAMKKKWKKRLAISLAVLVLLLTIGSLYVGNYFVEIALARKATIDDIAPSDSLGTEDAEIIATNLEMYKNKRTAVFSDPSLSHEVLHLTTSDGLRLDADCFIPAESQPHRWMIVVTAIKAIVKKLVIFKPNI